MSVKKYGIYLAYPPTVDLRAQGLGRYLTEFLKGAQERDDVRFIVACPSWTQQSLQQLCSDEGVDPETYEIISPRSKPLLLRAYEYYLKVKQKRIRRGRVSLLFRRLQDIVDNLYIIFEKKLVGMRSLILMILMGTFFLPFLFLVGIFRGIILVGFRTFSLGKRAGKLLLSKSKIQTYREQQQQILAQPKQDSRVVRMYRYMEEAESALVRKMIDRRRDVIAWYCPTAFWPHFNEISAPRLMCVPDVVLGDFPAGFAGLGGDRVLENFRQVEEAIRGGEYFATYSRHVMWHTLVKRYNVNPDDVFVVPHGANRLDELVVVSGFSCKDTATDKFCTSLFRTALDKAVNHTTASIFSSGDVRFIFYASQFRPNKNVMSLLRAYEYLLKRRYIGLKLVLTGNPINLPEINHFISENNLENDVLCLHGLTAQELAACYRLADLAVNPSLSEGGCPFTFAEAISVGTPVVMARIPVTEEVIVDPELNSDMLFDPYDYKDMAKRIEWALENKGELYKRQHTFFEEVVGRRTWRNVVDDYIDILDSIAESSRVKH